MGTTSIYFSVGHLTSPEYLNSSGDEWYEQGEYDSAVRYYEQAISVAPTDSLYKLNLVKALKALGKYDEAAAVEKAAEIDQAGEYNSQGDKAFSAKDYWAAERHYRKALNLVPKKFLYTENLCKTLKILNRHDEAIEVALKDPSSDSDKAEYYNTKGQQAMRIGDYRQAEWFHKKAVLYAPQNPLYKQELCYALQSVGKPSEAKDVVKSLAPDAKEKAATHATWGDIYYEQQNYGAAEEHYREAIKYDPENPIYQQNHCNMLRLLGKYDEAIDLAAKYKLDSPLKAYLYNARGDAFYRAGDYEAAARDYELAMSYDPTMEVFQFNFYAAVSAFLTAKEEEEKEKAALSCGFDIVYRPRDSFDKPEPEVVEPIPEEEAQAEVIVKTIPYKLLLPQIEIKVGPTIPLPIWDRKARPAWISLVIILPPSKPPLPT